MARLVAYFVVWFPLALPLAGRAPVPEPNPALSWDADEIISPRSKRGPPILRGDFVPHRPAGRQLGQETFWR